MWTWQFISSSWPGRILCVATVLDPLLRRVSAKAWGDGWHDGKRWVRNTPPHINLICSLLPCQQNNEALILPRVQKSLRALDVFASTDYNMSLTLLSLGYWTCHSDIYLHDKLFDAGALWFTKLQYITKKCYVSHNTAYLLRLYVKREVEIFTATRHDNLKLECLRMQIHTPWNWPSARGSL